ncbi:hypothetical protein BC628DRAFT_1414680 [Trametes gibbosa]|nr:hypothetical protein BC628DRAFT_1414680 [Trametes gibbosa]
MASRGVLEAHYQQAPRRQDDLMPHAHSRSASVLSSVHGRNEDDLSSIMMRGATDLRNAKFDLEEQRREIARLQSQVDSTRKERDELSQKLRALKDTARQSLQTSSKSLEGLRSTLSELKTQSEGSFAFIDDARSSLVDVQALRESISSSMKDIESHLEGGEEWSKKREAKGIMNALELECSKSQQVADLLRDRLQSVGGDLIEAKSRVADLETVQADDRAALSRANILLARNTEEVTSLASCVKKQQGELYETLSVAAESEAKAQVAIQRIQELQELLSAKEDELRALGDVHSDLARLREVIEGKDACITKLENKQIEMSGLRATNNELRMRIAELATLGSSKVCTIADHSDRIQRLEEELREKTNETTSLVENLSGSKARELSSAADIQRMHDERGVLTEKINELEATVGRARQELETRSARLQEAELRFQALEDRFEDQSVTLRITREAVADSQERLLAAEVSYAKQLAESTAKLEQEIAILREQKLGLQATIDVMDSALKSHEKTAQALQEEHAERLKEQGAAHADLLAQERKHAQRLTDDLMDSRARIGSSEVKNRELEEELSDLRRQLKDAQLPSPETETELRTLRSRIATLEAAEMRNTVRAKTIESRYRNGDLNDEEKGFINSLIHTSQAIHEQEMVANRNELRRRDNALKEMRAKVHLLENTLARHLNPPKSKPAQRTVGDRSMIDPTAWMSSGQSSSPFHAPDRDAQTNVDVPVPAKVTPTHARIEPVPLIEQAKSAHPTPGFNQGQLEHTQVRQSPAAGPVVSSQTKKPNFSRLATDCSDEILDFDDDHGALRISPTSSLGKRGKSNTPPQPPDVQNAPKPLKRPRTTARKVEQTDASLNAPPKKVKGSEASLNPRHLLCAVYK